MNEVMDEQQIQQASTTGESAAGPLLPRDAVQDLRSKWDRIQTGFVDEPRTAVKEANDLVANAIKQLEDSFNSARGSLERQWDRGDQVSTEDLRIALRKYRVFFDRLLAI